MGTIKNIPMPVPVPLSFNDLVGRYKNIDFLVVNNGPGMNGRSKEVNDFIASRMIVTIGVHNISSICIPDFHLWTDSSAYFNFAELMSPRSLLIVNENISNKLVQRCYHNNYYRVEDNTVLNYFTRVTDTISRYGHAAHCGAVVASLMGAKKVYIIGFNRDMFSTADLEKLCALMEELKIYVEYLS